MWITGVDATGDGRSNYKCLDLWEGATVGIQVCNRDANDGSLHSCRWRDDGEA